MQRLIFALAVVVVAIFFVAQGFLPVYSVPTAEDVAAGGIYSEDAGIETAMTEIYFNVDIMGLKNATGESLAEDFEVDQSLFSAVYGKYSDGRFGIADVIIVQPRYGREEEATDALESIRDQRAYTFANFDVYDSTEISKNGSIFRCGDYIILLMIDDQDNARTILEKYIDR